MANGQRTFRLVVIGTDRRNSLFEVEEIDDYLNNQFGRRLQVDLNNWTYDYGEF